MVRADVSMRTCLKSSGAQGRSAKRTALRVTVQNPVLATDFLSTLICPVTTAS